MKTIYATQNENGTYKVTIKGEYQYEIQRDYQKELWSCDSTLVVDSCFISLTTLKSSDGETFTLTID